MHKRNPIRDAVSVALTGGLAAALTGAPSTVLAQDEDVLEQPRQYVTGSRILRSTTETSSPITTITREQIDATGNVSISYVIRNISANNFGSFYERSGVAGGALGNSGVDLRGLGSGRTLVLLDGRRWAKSAGRDGNVANLNLIPLVAVERIEVLRDSASAIYGSDAIAGVINIIMRKDYEGVHMTVQFSRPTQDGGNEDQANLVGGVTSAKGNVTFGVDYSRKSMIFNGDRTFSATGLSSFGFPGSFNGSSPDLSPGGPFTGSRFISTMPDPRCPATLGGSSTFPDSVFVGTGTPGTPGASGRCRFNYAATSASDARIKRQSVFLKADFDVGADTTLFTRVIAAQNESFGRYAPTPQVGGAPFLPTMAASNPNNPTSPANGFVPVMLPDLALDASGNVITLTTSTAYTGPFNLSIFYRNVPGGFRDTTVDDDLFDVVLGVEGSLDLFNGSEWSVALQSSRTKARDTSVGLASREGLNSVIADGSFDIFGINGPTSATVAQTFVVDGFTDAETYSVYGDATLNFDAGELSGGPVSWAFGLEYEDTEYQSDFDAIANAGGIDGSAGGADVMGARTRFSAFGEALIPLLSNLEVDLALRYDDYNDFGDEVSPKIGVAYRPVDQLLIRGTYGEGFRAPDMDQLYSPQSQSFNGAIDTLGCSTTDFNGNGIPDDQEDSSLFPPGHPCISTQYNNLTGGNTSLTAETSENYGAGVVWSPTEDVVIGVDYYNIKLDQEIGVVPLQTIIDRAAAGDMFFSSLITRNPPIPPLNNAGQIVSVVRTNSNLSGRETDGVDINGSWNFGFDAMGDFRATATWTHVLGYDVSVLPGDPFVRLNGQLESDDKGVIGLGWQRGDFSGQLNWNYVGEVTDGIASGWMLSAWSTFDLQFGWDTPWQGKISVGARNLTDEDPPIDLVGGDSPYFLNTFHNIYGRVPYIRYEQDL